MLHIRNRVQELARASTSLLIFSPQMLSPSALEVSTKTVPALHRNPAFLFFPIADTAVAGLLATRKLS